MSISIIVRRLGTAKELWYDHVNSKVSSTIDDSHMRKPFPGDMDMDHGW